MAFRFGRARACCRVVAAGVGVGRNFGNPRLPSSVALFQLSGDGAYLPSFVPSWGVPWRHDRPGHVPSLGAVRSPFVSRHSATHCSLHVFSPGYHGVDCSQTAVNITAEGLGSSLLSIGRRMCESIIYRHYIQHNI